MKYLLLVVLMVFAYSKILSQDTIEVVTVDSVSADKLFSRAKVFITSAFKSGKDVTQLVDEKENNIVAKGKMIVSLSLMKNPVRFAVSIQCKDNRYKYSFSDFVYEYDPGSISPSHEFKLDGDKPRAFSKKQWTSIKEQATDIVKEMIIKLKKQMAINSDW